MGLVDILGYAIYSVLIAGFGWGLIDLLIKIHKQPKRPLSTLRMTSYPFVPDDETLEALRKNEGSIDGLRPSPVPVESSRNSYR